MGNKGPASSTFLRDSETPSSNSVSLFRSRLGDQIDQSVLTDPSIVGCLTRIAARLEVIERTLTMTAPAPASGYVDTLRAANFLGVSRKLLEFYRQKEVGPPFARFGRAVRYSIQDLVIFMERQKKGPL